MKITTKPATPATDAAAITPPPAPDFGADRQAAKAPPERNVLESTIIDMDAVTQGALKEIESVAKMALQWMESPDGVKHLEVVAHALRAIWSRAEQANEVIGHLATEVGCAWVDEESKRRYDAYVIAQQR